MAELSISERDFCWQLARFVYSPPYHLGFSINAKDTHNERAQFQSTQMKKFSRIVSILAPQNVYHH